ncbi:MAG TPA: PASTA domain-containing protein [Galbitalea sp.]|nr:PASTA domain-containing protein [Galbitalea sp.]
MAPALSAQAVATRLVPSVVGWSASNAATALHSHGFEYSFKAPAHHKVGKPSRWTVTAQSPKGKARAAVRSKITLTVVKTSVYLAQGARSFYAEDYGTFSPISKSGPGTKTFSFPHGIASLIVRASHPGAGSFRVSELGKGEMSTGRSPIAVSGSYHGGVAIGLTKVRVRTTAIQVSGTGSWHITLIPVASAAVISFPSSGTGDQVFLYSGAASIRTVSSPGPTTFVLNQISSSSSPNLAVNESGNWTGKIGLQPGPSVIEIHSTGTWSIR